MPRLVSADIYDRLFEGDRRAAARLITTLETEPRRAAEIVRHVHERSGRAHIIGITGAPGAGKSTLVDGIVDELRNRGKTVGVIAVDPSSPFTGGALLGDRIRMQKRSTDKDVFIRSMGSRGSLGGVSSTTSDAIKVLDALGKDVIIVETVGVGQAEVDIVKVADTTIVVLVPGMGDEIQSIKAGIMEIADVFVVNKADRDGVDKTVAEVEMMLMMGLGSEDPRAGAAQSHDDTGHHGATDVTQGVQSFMDEDTVHLAERRSAPRRERAGSQAPPDDGNPGDAGTSFFDQLLAVGVWYPPIVKTVAEKADGIGAVLGFVDRHWGFLHETGLRSERQAARAERELMSNMKDKLVHALEDSEALRGRFRELVAEIAARREDPHTAAEELIAHFQDQRGASRAG